jgi:tetratricopeptide (TPR) repeat protein
MKAKFGATYGSYVKLRRLQQVAKRARLPRYRNEALKIADEIIESDPASQFAAAAGYLKGEIWAGVLQENTSKKDIKAAKEYLEKFVKQQPDGLYRGEALMLLGKISLEIEWNAKDAEKYYTAVLDYFRKAREKRDAVSLYAAINDDLKSQTAPTQKPTTLNQWKRIVYHDEDPLKLYNPANAPVWYIDNKEKECVFAVGFVAFASGKYDVAQAQWEKILSLSPDIAALDQRLPNVQSRLLQACRLHAMAFWPEDKAKIKDKNLRLRIQYAEYLILLEKFPEAIERFSEIYRFSDDLLVKAVAQLGRATAVDLEFKPDCKIVAEKHCEWILNQKTLQKEPVYARALLFYGQLKTSRNNLEKLAIPYFERYVREFPGGHDIRIAQYSLAKCYLKTGQLAKAERIYGILKDQEDIYSENLLKRIARFKQNGGAK